MMILAFDTYYYEEEAKTVCLQFEHWIDQEPQKIYSETLSITASDYVPGEFYKRELPCILSLLNNIDLTCINFIIVDGFVVVDNDGKYGLGGYLFKELNFKIPIIGVAKNNYVSLTHNKHEVHRGESNKPLYITSLGIDIDIAAEKIGSMAGLYRMPDLLKKLDTLTRQA